MKILLASILALGANGCLIEGFGDWEITLPDPVGERYTTSYGIVFYWVGPSPSYAAPEDFAVDLDRAADWWIDSPWGQSRHVGLSREFLLGIARSLPIQLFQGIHVPGNGSWTSRGWTWYGRGVQIAMEGIGYDPYLLDYTYGAGIARHEFEHVLRGDWHPATPPPGLPVIPSTTGVDPGQ